MYIASAGNSKVMVGCFVVTAAICGIMKVVFRFQTIYATTPIICTPSSVLSVTLVGPLLYNLIILDTIQAYKFLALGI